MPALPEPELPLDPDLEVDTTPAGTPRPVHLRPAFLGIVFVGGVFGTAAREGLMLVVPTVAGIPWAIFLANLLGAFLLGVLLEALARRGGDHGVRRTLRLLLGTGFMGGFTTYSALATDAALLFGEQSPGTGIAYGLGTVVFGVAATTFGITVGSFVRRRHAGVAL
ncbi:fluoride efflux transporter FluC [Protaetiibacter larvae]|uniref:Fluoride-specific ion channel FluC n=1 Tax=Protaetiibacter larvae TaxID=2592654 RepID=A0A5C1Y7G5_9MICO|nr:CrcB family protein [Protaetiibacter larvae]QEO09761.1 CrcB family protein [Protaetiibacter larvae]